MASTDLLPPIVRRAAIRTAPDDQRYKAKFDIRSASSDSVYRISFDSAPGAGYWVCSCRGNIAHGQCKHLTAMGLQGRKFGKQLEWVNKFSLLG